MAAPDELLDLLRRLLLESAAKAGPKALAVPGATASEFATLLYGGPTRIRSSSPTIGATLGQLIGNNPRRVHWTAMNRSVNNGALGWDRETTFANGVLLGAGGGFASMDVREDGEAVAWEVFAINDAAAGTWRIIEIERV